MYLAGGIIVNVFLEKAFEFSIMVQGLLALCHQWEAEGKWRRLQEGKLDDVQYDSTSAAFLQVYQVL